MPGRRKGRDDSDMGSEKEETGSFETLRDEGMYFVHVKQWQKAVESFTRASEMNPEDNVVLVTRAKCNLQLGMADNALADAEQALSNDKDYIMGLLMKAEALYQLGHFETALVFFHRGHKLRQERGEFRLGIQKAQEAINNSIGSPSSVKLDTTGDLSFFDKQDNREADEVVVTSKPVIEPEPPLEDDTDKKSSKKKTKRKKEGKKEGKKDSKKDHKKGVKGSKGAKTKKPPPKKYGKPGAQKATQKEREHPKSTADSKTIKQLLEELYCDKTYLEKLLNDENLTSGRSYMQREIKNCIFDGLNYLDSRADFWRQQKPMYARKRDKERMRRSGRSRPRDPVAYIMQNLEEIDEAQAEGRYESSLNTAKKLMKNVREMSEEELSNKWEILANIHSQMGNAYLEMGKYTPAIDNHEQDLDIAENNGLEDAKSRALDNIGRVYARRGHFEKAIEVWEKKLPLSKSPLEKTWLYHEIGRCYLESEKYDKAREYGEKSLTAAQEADDNGWQLHATVLVAQAEVKSKDNQSAQTSFEEALELAKNLEDDAAINAIQKALDEVKDKIAKGYRAGEDEDEGDEVDAKKVDYRPGEDDDGRKSSQSRDSKKIRSAEDDDNEGRKSRGSSRAEYEDDFEEDQAGGAPADPHMEDSQSNRALNDNVPGILNLGEQNNIRSQGYDTKNSTDRYINETEPKGGAVKSAKGDATVSDEFPVLADGLDADVNSSGSEELGKQEKLAKNENKIKKKSDDKYQANKEDFTETDQSVGMQSARQMDGNINGNRNDDQVTYTDGESAIQVCGRTPERGNAGQEAEIDDKDIDKRTSSEKHVDINAKTIIDNSGTNETGKQNQAREVSDFQANRNHSEEVQFKYINDTTGSRPSSKNSRASPPKSGSSHRLDEGDPELNYDIDESNTTVVKDKKLSKGETNQQGTKKLQTRSKSSELAGGVRQREKVIKQKSLDETSRTRKAITPKSTVVTKDEKTAEGDRKEKVLPTKKDFVGKSKKIQLKDPDIRRERNSSGNKSKTFKISENTKGNVQKGDASSKGRIARKPRSADNVINRQSVSKDPRRKSDISPYGMPLSAEMRSKKTTTKSPVLETQRSQITKLKKKSSDSERSQILPSDTNSTKRSIKSLDKTARSESGRRTASPVRINSSKKKKPTKDEPRGSQTTNTTSPIGKEVKNKSVLPEETAAANTIVSSEESLVARDGVKEQIIDRAPASPTRRSEGSGRRSVEAASPQKRSPLHSPTKRSLAGSPTKRSAQPSPSKMSLASRRQAYSPTKQSREVSFKEGSAKGSMKGSAKGSVGGRSAPGSAQQRASSAAGGSATGSARGSARGSAKGSVGGFAATTRSGKDEEEKIPDETQQQDEEEKGQTKAASPPPADSPIKEEVVEDETQQTKGQD